MSWIIPLRNWGLAEVSFLDIASSVPAGGGGGGGDGGGGAGGGAERGTAPTRQPVREPGSSGPSTPRERKPHLVVE